MFIYIAKKFIIISLCFFTQAKLSSLKTDESLRPFLNDVTEFTDFNSRGRAFHATGANLAYTLSPYTLWDMGTDSRCESMERSDLLGVYTFTCSVNS